MSGLRIERVPFGATAAGEPVDSWRFGVAGGIELEMITYGARIRSWHAPDATGRLDDIALGFDDVAAYERQEGYLGATVGRFANRIAGATFELDGHRHELVANEGPNILHGGPGGLSQQVWSAEPVDVDGRAGVTFGWTSPDGDMGFPGRLEVTVAYTLDTAGMLQVDYAATTDRATVVNLTQHVYLALGGAGRGTVEDDVIQVRADAVTEQTAAGIPTGRLLAVDGTVFDLRAPTRIGDALATDDPLLRDAGGFDHNFVLAARAEGEPVVRLVDPSSGRVLEVVTDQPGLQLYTGNQLEPSTPGKDGQRYGRWSALCLETQHFPDSPHHPHFPSTVLRPGDAFASTTRFAVSAPSAP